MGASFGLLAPHCYGIGVVVLWVYYEGQGGEGRGSELSKGEGLAAR